MWSPIEDAEIEQMAVHSVSQITDELLAMGVDGIPPFELCERALLYAYLAIEHPEDEWRDHSLACLNAAIDRLASTYVSNGLYGGLAGIGWVIEHVSRLLSQDHCEQAAGADDEDLLLEVDQHLMKQLMLVGTSHHNYDLIGGVVGTSLYWLERVPRTLAFDGLLQSLDYLRFTSEQVGSGITWFTPPPLVHPLQAHLAPGGFYNLGVAHGVPGIIGFLAKATRLKEHVGITDLASTLLVPSIEWLLEQRRPLHSPNRYSDWLPCAPNSGPSRLAWCYGDLGIAAVLHLAGTSTNHEAWVSEALEMAYACARRTKHTNIDDSTLCHGAFGVAHIFNRFYTATNEPAFRKTALYWFEKGFRFLQADGASGNDNARNPDASNRMRKISSLLMGTVGIALCLLSLGSSRDPHWDQLMLLS